MNERLGTTGARTPEDTAAAAAAALVARRPAATECVFLFFALGIAFIAQVVAFLTQVIVKCAVRGSLVSGGRFRKQLRIRFLVEVRSCLRDLFSIACRRGRRVDGGSKGLIVILIEIRPWRTLGGCFGFFDASTGLVGSAGAWEEQIGVVDCCVRFCLLVAFFLFGAPLGRIHETSGLLRFLRPGGSPFRARRAFRAGIGRRGFFSRDGIFAARLGRGSGLLIAARPARSTAAAAATTAASSRTVLGRTALADLFLVANRGFFFSGLGFGFRLFGQRFGFWEAIFQALFRRRRGTAAIAVGPAPAAAMVAALPFQVAVIGRLDVRDVQEAVAADAEIDECGLNAWLDVDDATLVDVADVALLARALDV